VSDTPRTDAAELIVDLWFISGIQSDWVVISKFARELERENAALRQSEENLASTVRGLEMELEKAQKEIANLRK
jgi:hypothetical protein